MASKILINHDDKVASKHRSSKPTFRETPPISQHIDPANVIQRASFEPKLPFAHDVLQLQRAIGNQAVQGLLGIPTHSPDSGAIQPKLAINEPGDEYEQEADRVSDEVMQLRKPQLPHDCACGGGCPKCQNEHLGQEEERLQTKRAGSGDAGQEALPSNVHEVLRSPGQPLDPAPRAFMESRFGHDFNQVRVHSDATAAESASAVNALAYTVGQDVVFAAGRYAPGTTEGDHLLAHELTHVVQQSGGREVRGANGPLFVSESGARIQREKDPKQKESTKLKHINGAAKALSKGVMVWAMWVVKNSNQVIMSISFTPFPPYQGKSISFLQTVRGRSGNAEIDVLTYGRHGSKTDDTEPFYNATWDNQNRTWAAEGAPDKFKNEPGSASSPIAYLYDVPMVYPGQTKMFETAVVVPETTEVLAFITWGAKGHDKEAEAILPPASEPSDAPSVGFLLASDRFYEQASTVGPDMDRPQRYDAILDRFPPNDATLTADQKKSLDPIAVKVKQQNDPSTYVSLGGFADATEKDPSRISEARAKAVESYLVAQGVPQASIVMTGFFGAAWARFPPSPTEDRNRRVQVRVYSGPTK